MDSREVIQDRHILIVEDIIDKGHTLRHLHRTLQAHKPASLRTCVLVKKKRPDVHFDIPLDYVGFEIPDVWVVGYGLDYDNLYRTLPHIAELKVADAGGT